MRRGRACRSVRVEGRGGAIEGKEEPEEGELRGLESLRGMVVGCGGEEVLLLLQCRSLEKFR